jgi:hypothetical protein
MAISPASPTAMRRVARAALSARRRMRRASSRKARPAGRQPHRAAGAVQQGDAQDALQQLDLPAERRLGHVQPLGGAAEMQLLGGGHEAAQLTQFEHRKAPARDPMDRRG